MIVVDHAKVVVAVLVLEVVQPMAEAVETHVQIAVPLALKDVVIVVALDAPEVVEAVAQVVVRDIVIIVAHSIVALIAQLHVKEGVNSIARRLANQQLGFNYYGS